MKTSAFQVWCLNMFAMLADGGYWGVPRSGLVFQRQADKLVLISSMPWSSEMEGVISSEALKEYQEDDFEAVREQFGLAGIEVVRGEAK